MPETALAVPSREIIAARFRAVADARHAEQATIDNEGDPWARADTQADRWLRSPRFTDGTRQQYGMIYQSWRTWCAMIAVPPFDATRSDVEAYTRALEAIGNPARAQPRPLTRRSIARHMAAISSYYIRAVDDGVAACNPVPKHDRPRVTRQSRQPHLDPDEIRALIAAADADSPRAAALIALLLLACLRISEALGADVDHLSRGKGAHLLWVRRKGDKSEHVPLPPQVYERLANAIGKRREGPVFITAGGLRLDRKAAWKTIRRLGHRAGIATPIGPHTLRHAYITRGHELGIPVADLQDAAGHASPITTRGYDQSKLDPDRHPSFAIATDLLPQP